MSFNLRNDIDICKEQVLSQCLYKNNNIDFTIFSFCNDEGLSSEIVYQKRFYYLSQGSALIKTDDKEFLVKEGSWLYLPDSINRSISSSEEFKIFMISIKGEMMIKYIEKESIFNLEDQIEYQKGKIASKSIVSNEKLTMTLFAFDGKQELSKHAAMDDALIIALDGEALLILNDKEHYLKKGDSLIMPAKAPHSLHVDKSFKMLLSIIG